MPDAGTLSMTMSIGAHMTVQHPKSGERTHPAGGGEANEGQGQRRAGKREAAALQAGGDGGARWPAERKGGPAR